MKTFIFGVVVGIIISTVGFGGVAQILDHGVNKVKTTSQELAEEKTVQSTQESAR